MFTHALRNFSVFFHLLFDKALFAQLNYTIIRTHPGQLMPTVSLHETELVQFTVFDWRKAARKGSLMA